jgi:excisionase family DNA binding protein
MTDARTNETPTSSLPRQAWRVREFCEAVRISRSHFYELMKRGELRTVTLGGRRLVPDSERARLLGELQNAGR